jgi:lipoyl(octanoyl) transferase
MIDLTRHKLGVRTLVDVIERSIVRTLAEFGITASPRPDAPGVYVDEAKIASLGLRVKRGCSFHGLALNVAMDMEPFRRINPCGYAGLAMCQVRDFVPGVELTEVTTVLSDELAASLASGSIRRIA